MARKGVSENGHNHLDEALATLIQNQATLVQNQAAFVSEMPENNRRHVEFKQRFARIEAQMEKIIRVLAEHSRLLECLPDAIRDKIGFKAPQ